MTRAVQPMKAIIELLQKELGETIPPVTSHFFIWLCFFFPNESNLNEAHRLNFKDAIKNMQPSLTSAQAAISEFHNYLQTATKVQKLMSKWGGDKHLQSEYSRVIMEILRILTQKSETRILKCLKGDAERFQAIASYYELKKVPKQLVLDLILRTSVKESDYGPGSIADKCVKGQLIFRCHGREIITVRGVIHGDGAGYPSWHILILDFTLPDGKPLRLYARHTPLQSESLHPVTELLQQGISQ